MTRFRPIAALFLLLTFAPGCRRAADAVDPALFQKEIGDWQATRLKRLTRDDGWLTLCGLFWLKDGENKFGSDSANSVILPPRKSPPIAGSLWLDHGVVRLEVRHDAHVTVGDSTVRSAVLLPDTSAKGPTVVAMGDVSFFVIWRSGQGFGVRVKDRQNDARVHFKGLDFFPADPTWRVTAHFEPYVPMKALKIATMINTVETDSSPGALLFSRGGRDYRLDALIENPGDTQFFIMFSDETSGKETYGPGRQLYTPLPGPDGSVTVDFNKAYNWPCVFTEFATCPIPPRENHLAVRVEAGEKMYRGH